jgi:hypothetical protein
MSGGQVYEQCQTDELAARKEEETGEIPFNRLRENLCEPLENAKLDAGKPSAEIQTIDDFPNVVVFLSERADKDQKDRRGKQHDGQP